MFKFKIVDYSLAMASQLALAACSHVDHSKGFIFTNRGDLHVCVHVLSIKIGVHKLCLFVDLVIDTTD